MCPRSTINPSPVPLSLTTSNVDEDGSTLPVEYQPTIGKPVVYDGSCVKSPVVYKFGKAKPALASEVKRTAVADFQEIILDWQQELVPQLQQLLDPNFILSNSVADARALIKQIEEGKTATITKAIEKVITNNVELATAIQAIADLVNSTLKAVINKISMENSTQQKQQTNEAGQMEKKQQIANEMGDQDYINMITLQQKALLLASGNESNARARITFVKIRLYNIQRAATQRAMESKNKLLANASSTRDMVAIEEIVAVILAEIKAQEMNTAVQFISNILSFSTPNVRCRA